MASIFSVIISFLLGFFKKKEQGVAAIDTVIGERNKALESIQDAKNISERVNSDSALRDRVQSEYQRD